MRGKLKSWEQLEREGFSIGERKELRDIENNCRAEVGIEKFFGKEIEYEEMRDKLTYYDCVVKKYKLHFDEILIEEKLNKFADKYENFMLYIN